MKKQFFGLIAFAIMLSACGNSNTKTEKTTEAPKTSETEMKADTSGITATEKENEVVVDTSSTIVTPSDGVQLQLNLAKGKTYHQTMDINAEQEGGKMSTGINWGYDMKVKEDNGKTKILDITYRRIAMSMNMGGQKMEISSDSKMEASPNNPLGMMVTIFRAMNGKSFQMEVSKDGEVKSVKGFDAIAESVADEIKFSGEQKVKMQQAFKSQFNDGMVKDMFAQSFNIYPGKKVKVGDRWEKKSSTMMGKNAIATTTTYAVKSIKGNRVELASNAKHSMEGQQASSQGTFIVDARNGMVLSGNLLQNMGGERQGVSRIIIKGKEL